MLKQSLVQEKLSDLMINSSSKLAGVNNSVGGDDKSAQAVIMTGDLKLVESNNKTNRDLLPSQHNMPQWPRVQLDKQITSNLKRNSKIIVNNSASYEASVQNLTNSRNK